MIYLKPSPLGLTVSTGVNLLVLKDDLSLTAVAPLYSTMSESDMIGVRDILSGAYSQPGASTYFNYSAADSKFLNWGFVDPVNYYMRTIYSDLDGSNSQEHLFSDVSLETPDGTGTMAYYASERARTTSFTPTYVPQENSLLYMGHTGSLGYQMFIYGKNGILDASPP
ncbi:hypothetical protein D3C72_1919640 [compost metagenome]